jgi:cysteinyl-tRNA synthetase
MSTLSLYNTLTRRKEAFVPITPGRVAMYVCGPTVYDYFHVGNARTFTVFDMVQRWLKATGYAVTYARNITDIDDKIIERANANGEAMESLTARMIAAMHEDFDRLMLERPSIEPRATRHVANMLAMIAALEAKGLAYRGGNGDVYYAVREFAGYGKLSRKNPDELRAGERVAVATDKRDPLDFALWKAAKPGEPSWPSAFGAGRPGWHIECSAMCRAELGERIDIHGGGWDLQFPHHENEIAQSEGVLGHPFVNTWMHAAFLNMAAEKMSKSLGNFFTAREVLDKLDPVQGGETLRFFLLRGHYRSELAYIWDMLADAGQTLRGFYTAMREIPPETVAIDWADPWALRFRAAMDDDFDTPVAFAVLHDLRGEVNRTRSARLSGILKALGGTIGLLQHDPEAFLKGGVVLDVDALIAERNAARKAKDFARSDAIRRQLEEGGVVLEDKPGGTTEWRRK